MQKAKKQDQIIPEIEMEDTSDYEVLMTKQEWRNNQLSPKNTPSSSRSPKPSLNTQRTKKNLGSLFSNDPNFVVASSFCSLLNQQFSEGKKVNPGTFSPKLMETIQAMVEEGTLPDDKTMEEVLTEQQALDMIKSEYT